MPVSHPCTGTLPRHLSPWYERAETFQRPTAPSPHIPLRSQNATVETEEKMPRSPTGCLRAFHNTCHPCLTLERPGLLSQPRYVKTIGTPSLPRPQRSAGQSPVRVSPQQMNPNTAPWAIPVTPLTHHAAPSVFRKLLNSTHRCSARTPPNRTLHSRSLRATADGLARPSESLSRVPGPL